MAKQKRDLSLIVWAFGWLLGIATALKKFATEHKVPFEAFERLGSDQGKATIEKIVQLIYFDWVDERPKSRVIAFESDRRRINIACTLLDGTLGERSYRVAEVPGRFLDYRIEDVWHELVDHFDREGDRFAIKAEAHEFWDSKVGPQSNRWILSCLKRVDDGDDREVAVLDTFGTGHNLSKGSYLLLVASRYSVLAPSVQKDRRGLFFCALG